MERLSTSDKEQAAYRSIVDAWVYALEEDLLAAGDVSGQDASVLVARTNELIEKRLAAITELAPAFSAALRGYRAAVAGGENATAEALLAWVSGQPNVAAAAKRTAGIKGEIDHFSALGFLQGLLIMLRDAGFAGLVLVLDEVETLKYLRLTDAPISSWDWAPEDRETYRRSSSPISNRALRGGRYVPASPQAPLTGCRYQRTPCPLLPSVPGESV
jgi:hypothetical protein